MEGIYETEQPHHESDGIGASGTAPCTDSCSPGAASDVHEQFSPNGKVQKFMSFSLNKKRSQLTKKGVFTKKCSPDHLEHYNLEDSSDDQYNEKETMCDSRGQSYPQSPPQHCKVKPQLSFMKFIRSDKLVGATEVADRTAGSTDGNSGSSSGSKNIDGSHGSAAGGVDGSGSSSGVPANSSGWLIFFFVGCYVVICRKYSLDFFYT